MTQERPIAKISMSLDYEDLLATSLHVFLSHSRLCGLEQRALGSMERNHRPANADLPTPFSPPELLRVNNHRPLHTQVVMKCANVTENARLWKSYTEPRDAERCLGIRPILWCRHDEARVNTVSRRRMTACSAPSESRVTLLEGGKGHFGGSVPKVMVWGVTGSRLVHSTVSPARISILSSMKRTTDSV